MTEIPSREEPVIREKNFPKFPNNRYAFVAKATKNNPRIKNSK